MIKNLVRSLALFDRSTKDLVDEVNDERDTLHKRKVQLEAQLAEAEEQIQQTANPNLLDALPAGRSAWRSYRRTSPGDCSKPSGSNSATARAPTG
ncbi:hypothetical protein [Amycolatopsis sp. CA-126428]|uniref:hypothetical protein n=1 Tax=Amycolatopsis sp. CA-126428 TaxID=2073158 RepID=UPI001E5553D4|nr:hypothetical protein [Amycolatopsis sp. CA-126428]